MPKDTRKQPDPPPLRFESREDFLNHARRLTEESNRRLRALDQSSANPGTARNSRRLSVYDLAAKVWDALVHHLKRGRNA